MKISLNWLGDFVDLDGFSSSEIADFLSLHTAEVEGVEIFGAGAAGVVVGEVVSCDPHPDADKLSVTRVDCGKGDPVQVVCGAPNVAKGQRIAFAPLGATLPDGTVLEKVKLRGQESLGMICSRRELGLGQEHDGILVLGEESSLGAPIGDVLGPPDSVLDLDNKSLTHRPDLWGHYGFARELSAILKRPLKALDLVPEWDSTPGEIPIRIEDEEGCPHYLGLQIDLGNPVGKSGEAIARRLEAVGVRPHNDFVDLTNYLMLEIGQPTHAFDLDLIEGPGIVVRAAAEGELLATLDGVSRKLLPGDLVIADAVKCIALAGLMGGEETEIHEGTRRVLLESGVFHPARVRRTSGKHALRTDASSRFEKSLDPALAPLALRRFAHLLGIHRPQDTVQGPPSIGGVLQQRKVTVSLSIPKASTALGLSLEPSGVETSLEALGFTTAMDGEAVTVEVPSWRATRDVEGPEDLLEEVGRIVGYDKIQAAPLLAPVEAPIRDSRLILARDLTRRMAAAHQGHETQGYSFLAENWVKKLGLDPKSFLRLRNPVQDGVCLIRKDPIASLLQQAEGNLRESPRGVLFELGKGYLPQSSGEPAETAWLGVVLWQPHEEVADGPSSLFGRSKSLVEDLLNTAAVGNANASSSSPHPWGHPVRTLAWESSEQGVAWAGSVTPGIRDFIGKGKADLAWALLDLDACLAAGATSSSGFRAPSRFPGIKVDVALALPSKVTYAQVVDALRGAAGEFLESLSLFDVFEGPPLEDGQRSLAFRAVLRDAERTLSEKEEQEFLSAVERVAVDLGGAMRS